MFSSEIKSYYGCISSWVNLLIFLGNFTQVILLNIRVIVGANFTQYFESRLLNIFCSDTLILLYYLLLDKHWDTVCANIFHLRYSLKGHTVAVGVRGSEETPLLERNFEIIKIGLYSSPISYFVLERELKFVWNWTIFPYLTLLLRYLGLVQTSFLCQVKSNYIS